MIPLSCMSEDRRLFSTVNNMRELINFSIKKWKVDLYSGDTTLGKVKIK